jgi:hypothetical protein
MSKHTPGPWTIAATAATISAWTRPRMKLLAGTPSWWCGYFPIPICTSRHPFVIVAEVPLPVYTTHAEAYEHADAGLAMTANARLIAAAPDLLAALIDAEKYIANALDRHTEANRQACAHEATDKLAAARAAIAKATAAQS